MNRFLFVLVVVLLACNVSPPHTADMSGRPDAAETAYLDLAKPDQFAPRDFHGLDLSCVPCNPFINPCPALGLYCWPIKGCCDSVPH